MRSGTGQGGQKKRSFIEQARRAQIINAAIETIGEVGYANASLARIARHAGISKGVISYHFAGKDELMEQVVTHVYTAIIEHVVPRIVVWDGARDRLRVHILTLAEFMREQPVRLKALGEIFGNFRDADGQLRYDMASSVELFESLEHTYRIGQESGEFRDFDTRVMAVSMQTSIDAMFGYWMAFPETDLMAYAAQLADLFDHATRALPEGSPAGTGARADPRTAPSAPEDGRA
jgi:AcrR family transcriptional regulator